jgi:hypothetical protein
MKRKLVVEIKNVRLSDGTLVSYNELMNLITANQDISSNELAQRLFNELWTMRHSMFSCPVCGYKVQYEEFFQSGKENIGS